MQINFFDVQRREEESNAEWAQRRFAERILAVNPNYVDE